MAAKGKGAKLHLFDSAATPTPILVKISEVLSLTPPSPTRDTIDVTSHDSTGDYREFISSLLDAGEATILINWNPGTTQDTLIHRMVTDGALIAFAIDVNKGPGATNPTKQHRISGSCIPSNYGKADVVIDDKMTATITLKVSGPLVMADAP
jgi:predicted secreted protein